MLQHTILWSSSVHFHCPVLYVCVPSHTELYNIESCLLLQVKLVIQCLIKCEGATKVDYMTVLNTMRDIDDIH